MINETAIQVREREADLYATHEDFHSIFSESLNELHQLSFLLTRDPAKAERCLASGLEHCVTGNRVFREWARSWARRTIVKNAIRELKPRIIQSNAPLSQATFPYINQIPNCPGETFAMDSVLSLDDFDRFVFVMSVLEHYTEHDCVLLLSCSLKEFREARARAFKELMNSSKRHRSHNQPFIKGTQ